MNFKLKIQTYFNARVLTASSSSEDKVERARPVGDIITLADEFEQSQRN